MLQVCWSDGAERAFPLIWLRDNCACHDCLHPHTRERTFNLLSVPRKLSLSTLKARADCVEVEWREEPHVSRFEGAWLRAFLDCADCADAQAPLRRAPRLWQPGQPPDLKRFPHEAIMADVKALHAWLDALLADGAAVVTGVPGEDKAVLDVAKRIAYPRPTNFGLLFEVRSEVEPINNAYTPLPLSNHTDLVNWEQPPGFQFLHCLHNAASGGESTLVDGYAVADAIRRSDAGLFEQICTTPVVFRYHDDGRDMQVRAPIIALDHDGALLQIRFNVGIFGIQSLPPETQLSLYTAYRAFAEMLHSQAFVLRFRLAPGELLVIDNWRILHGRTAFDPSTGKRHLQGCYVDRDEVLSRWRVTRT